MRPSIELAALREVVEGLTEGLDTPAVARARALSSRAARPRSPDGSSRRAPQI